MAHPTWLGKTVGLGAGAVAVAHLPVLAGVLGTVALGLVSALALTGALSTDKVRRDAAYAVLKLLLDLLR